MINTVWNLARPVLIVVLALLGWVTPSANLFLMIIVASLIMDYSSIKKGFIDIYNAITKK